MRRFDNHSYSLPLPAISVKLIFCPAAHGSTGKHNRHACTRLRKSCVAAYLKMSTMLVDNRGTEPEAHARSFESLGCEEGFENPFDVLSRDAHSIIGNCDPDGRFCEITTHLTR